MSIFERPKVCVKSKRLCTIRESNSWQMLGRHLCYHYTNGAAVMWSGTAIYNCYYDLKSKNKLANKWYHRHNTQHQQAHIHAVVRFFLVLHSSLIPYMRMIYLVMLLMGLCRPIDANSFYRSTQELDKYGSSPQINNAGLASKLHSLPTIINSNFNDQKTQCYTWIIVGNESSFLLLSGVVETLDILCWMLSEDKSGLKNVECKQTNQ